MSSEVPKASVSIQTLRLARVALTDEEFTEWLRRIAMCGDDESEMQIDFQDWES
jgi:hypothetical protein